MSLLRRFSAALSALLLLHLTLLGSGSLCALQDSAITTGASMAGMPGMAAHGSATGALAHQSSNAEHPSAPSSCDAKGGTSDCGLPWSPGACATMTTCATVVAPSVVTLTSLDLLAAASELPEPAQLRTGHADAPELPPPRA